MAHSYHCESCKPPRNGAHPIPPEQVSQILALNCCGASVHKIAHIVNRSHQTVCNVLRRHGIKSDGKKAFIPRVMHEHHNWQGGVKDQAGYVHELIPTHENAGKKGYVPQHRRVMAEHIGRPIAKHEIVHHINGDKRDNRIENLRLMTQSEHMQLHNSEAR